MRATLLLFASVLLVACGGDDDRPAGDAGGRTDAARLDAGGSDAGGTDAGGTTDAGGATDAGGSDAGTSTDAGTPTDGGACQCIEQTLEFGFTGGFTLYEDTSSVSACRDYTLSRDDRSGGAPTTCTNEVPCDEPAVTMAELLAALAHPDVVAAFAAAPITYGRDLRPVDAPIYSVTQDGDTFLVGSPCMGSAGGCIPIPAGVQALVTLLQTLTTERNAAEPCASTFP